MHFLRCSNNVTRLAAVLAETVAGEATTWPLPGQASKHSGVTAQHLANFAL